MREKNGEKKYASIRLWICVNLTHSQSNDQSKLRRAVCNRDHMQKNRPFFQHRNSIFSALCFHFEGESMMNSNYNGTISPFFVVFFWWSLNWRLQIVQKCAILFMPIYRDSTASPNCCRGWVLQHVTKSGSVICKNRSAKLQVIR